jgi:hypothetical protein
MLPFLPFHAVAAQRGDGLRPELLALFAHHGRSETGLVVIIEPVETGSAQLAGEVSDSREKEWADGATASVSCAPERGQ